MSDPASMTAAERWLATTWQFVHKHLPPTPARVLEIGCGTAGGFVPALRSAGYDAVGVDPAAPAGPGYHQTQFEHYEATTPVEAIVACTSLHHVADLDAALDHVASALTPDGVLVVIEWAHESFDETTARWCFERLSDLVEPGWLHRHREMWSTSRRSWDSYLASWALAEGLHTGRDIVRALETRFHTRLLTEAPYLFSDLDGVTEGDEQAAIDTGQIRATGIRYVANKRAAAPLPDGTASRNRHRR